MKPPLENLLRATMGSSGDGPSTPCLDPETAAAFADGTLTDRERSDVEAHAADCARCGALLATIVRITPAPAVRAWWRMPAFAWLAPAAATAAAVAVWIAVQDRAGPPQQLALQELRPESPAAGPPVETGRSAARSARPPATSEARPAAQADGPAAKTAAAAEAPRMDAPADPPAVAPSRPTAAPPAAAPSASTDGARTTVAVQQAPAAPAPAEPAPRAAREQRAEAAAEDTQPRALADATVERPSSAASSAGEARVGSVAESFMTKDEAARARSAFSGGVVGTTIVSSDPQVRWQLSGGATVQRSTDGGTTWQPQSTGVTVPLTGGASPSPDVCWLVGRSGLVLLTLDGGTSWQRLPAPTDDDLITVRATDGRSASVATAGGRTFTTSDRGGTWRR